MGKIGDIIALTIFLLALVFLVLLTKNKGDFGAVIADVLRWVGK